MGTGLWGRLWRCSPGSGVQLTFLSQTGPQPWSVLRFPNAADCTIIMPEIISGTESVDLMTSHNHTEMCTVQTSSCTQDLLTVSTPTNQSQSLLQLPTEMCTVQTSSCTQDLLTISTPTNQSQSLLQLPWFSSGFLKPQSLFLPECSLLITLYNMQGKCFQ